MLLKLSYTLSVDDTRVLQLMAIWKSETKTHWPIGIAWFCHIPNFLCTAYGAKVNYLSAITSFSTIFAILKIPINFRPKQEYRQKQEIFSFF